MANIKLGMGKEACSKLKEVISDKNRFQQKDIKGIFILDGKYVIVDLEVEFGSMDLTDKDQLIKALEQLSGKRAYWLAILSKLNRMLFMEEMRLDSLMARARVSMLKKKDDIFGKDKPTKEDIGAKFDVYVSSYISKIIGFGDKAELPTIKSSNPISDIVQLILEQKAKVLELEEAKHLVSAVVDAYHGRGTALNGIKDLVISFK